MGKRRKVSGGRCFAGESVQMHSGHRQHILFRHECNMQLPVSPAVHHFPRIKRCASVIFRLALVKLAILAGCAVCVWNFGDTSPWHEAKRIKRWSGASPPVFARHFATADGRNYLILSEFGYARDSPLCAFYPLWPLIIRAGASVSGGNHLIAALVLSNLFSLCAWVLFYRLVEHRWGRETTFWSLIFLIAYPGSLFFQFGYTESLFLFLLMGLWWGLQKQRYELAGAFAFLLPLCRGNGVFAIFPLGWLASNTVFQNWLIRRRGLQPCHAGLGWLISSPTTEPSATEHPATEFPCRNDSVIPRNAGLAKTRPGVPVWLVGMPLLGWGFYLILMWQWTGNPFEGFYAQHRWGSHSVQNLWSLPKFIATFFHPTAWHDYTGSLLDRCIFCLFLYTLPVLWRLDKVLLVWTVVLGIIPAMSGLFTSYTRYASCIYPMFIALGFIMSQRQWRVARIWLLAAFATLYAILLWRHVNFRWAG